MTIYEVASSCLALLALLVSIIALYFSRFHKKVALVGCLLDWNKQHILQENSDPLTADVTFSLSNTGNRELLVREVEIDYVDPPPTGIVPFITCAQLPCVLKPSEILQISFELPLLFMQWIGGSGQKMLLTFNVVSPDGVRYVLSKHFSPMTAEFQVDKRDWDPFFLKRAPR